MSSSQEQKIVDLEKQLETLTDQLFYLRLWKDQHQKKMDRLREYYANKATEMMVLLKAGNDGDDIFSK